MERIGLTDKIQDRLDSYCIGGYSNGTIGQANQNYLLNNYSEFVRVQRIYRLGDALIFTPPKLGAGLGGKFIQFLEELSGLEDYPLLDDDTYQQVMDECEMAEVERICQEYNIDESVAWDVLNVGGWYFEDTDGMADIYGMSMYGGTLEEFVEAVHRASQNWDVHYNNSEFHHAGVCAWCQDETLPSSMRKDTPNS